MSFIKNVILITCVLSFSNAAFAAPQWTGSNVWGTGVGVEAIYPQFGTKQLIFKASDGQFYYYQWASTALEMPGDVKAMMSILLTAFSTGKNVNVYADPAVTSNGRINFLLISVVK